MSVDGVAEETVRHPAKFSVPIVGVINQVLTDRLPRQASILDPFAGVGGIHVMCEDRLRWRSFAIEIEPEWAEQSTLHGWTWAGDFFEFDPNVDRFSGKDWTDNRYLSLKTPEAFDCVVTSPAYGNRMADHHVPSEADKSRRLTYRHSLGRELTDNNSGAMQWGPDYRAFHVRAWKKVHALLVPGGLFVLNVKNHVRRGKVQHVAEWHRERCQRVGFELLEDNKVPVPGMRFGANSGLRVEHEHVYVFKKGNK